ncbi:hypothetical protein MJ389_12965 [Escherichia coli]|nr:hypothetical protein MJ389_26685 [Escherichia coli]UMX53778.1 hypothetical protein MJ389_12965 [Escherichia coli]
MQNTALSPHPCGLPPAFRERLSDFEAVSTGSFSRKATMANKFNGRSHEPYAGQGVSRRPA